MECHDLRGSTYIFCTAYSFVSSRNLVPAKVTDAPGSQALRYLRDANFVLLVAIGR